MNVSDEDEARILDKAEFVEEALLVLSRKRSLDESTYRNDREQRAIVERMFQTAIEACLDIAGILIASTDEPMPETSWRTTTATTSMMRSCIGISRQNSSGS